ncbi:MAG: hypothetical protein I4O49_15805, partial [Janthinobacterium lividum]|nr:hypothetical protein [Janthinobacterium lividum]
MQRQLRRAIGDISQCGIEIRQRLRRAPGLAQKLAIIIAQLGIVGRKAHCVKKIFFSRISLVQGSKNQRTHAERLGIARQQLHRLLRFG